jgi:hypothetical protein
LKQITHLYNVVVENNLKCTKNLVQFVADVNTEKLIKFTALGMTFALERKHIMKVSVEKKKTH